MVNAIKQIVGGTQRGRVVRAPDLKCIGRRAGTTPVRTAR